MICYFCFSWLQQNIITSFDPHEEKKKKNYATVLSRDSIFNRIFISAYADVSVKVLKTRMSSTKPFRSLHQQFHAFCVATSYYGSGNRFYRQHYIYVKITTWFKFRDLYRPNLNRCSNIYLHLNTWDRNSLWRFLRIRFVPIFLFWYYNQECKRGEVRSHLSQNCVWLFVSYLEVILINLVRFRERGFHFDEHEEDKCRRLSLSGNCE